MNIKKTFFLVLVLFTSLNAEIQYSHRGYFDLGTINRLSDGSMIKIPYRMLMYEPTISYQNFHMITSTAIEFRIKEINDIWGSDFDFDLRELYLEWITSAGEFSIGKQIISWGSASANNPTDNISPYNYYYLFSEGKEQKEGILALNSTLYVNDLKINAIFIPEHQTNILPLNDSEFLISSPITPKDEQIMSIKNPQEYALSISIPTLFFDITTSYFLFGLFPIGFCQGFNSPISPRIVIKVRKGIRHSWIMENILMQLPMPLLCISTTLRIPPSHAPAAMATPSSSVVSTTVSRLSSARQTSIRTRWPASGTYPTCPTCHFFSTM